MLSIGTTTICFAQAFETIQGRKTVANDHQEVIADINRQSEINQTQFERYAQMGDGMTINSYNCDPSVRPEFDAVPWAKPDTSRPVYSADQYHIGEVRSDGFYYHFGVCNK